MKILAIESSSMVASVAIVTDDILTAEYTVNFKKTHSQTLLPMIDEISSILELDLSTIDVVAVSAGPGSFTGLRIGAATGKGLGLALEKPMIEIPTVDALAYNLYNAKDLICPIMDARRNQVYTGLYYFRDEFKVEKKQCSMDMAELVSELNERGEDVVFLGDGVAVHKAFIEENLKVGFQFAPAHTNRHRAASVAALAKCYWEENKVVSAAAFEPDYLKKSQAERELDEKGQTNYEL